MPRSIHAPKGYIFYVVMPIFVGACSIGGEYGHGVGYASPEQAISSRPIQGSSQSIAAFLKAEFSKICPNSGIPIIRSDSSGHSYNYWVRGLQGCVVVGSRQWELLQITFVPNGHDISVVVDGWLASGFEYPSDTQFTKSMEPGYGEQVRTFAQTLAGDFGGY